MLTLPQAVERVIRSFQADALVLRPRSSDSTHVTDTLQRLTEEQEKALFTALSGTLCTTCGSRVDDSSDVHLTVRIERTPPADAAVVCGPCARDLLKLVLHTRD